MTNKEHTAEANAIPDDEDLKERARLLFEALGLGRLSVAKRKVYTKKLRKKRDDEFAQVFTPQFFDHMEALATQVKTARDPVIH